MKNSLYFILIIFLAACTATRQSTDAPKAPAKAEIITDSGTITLLLYDKTPQHRDNFIKLVRNNFYDSLLFHRVVSNFMIQGGDPESKYAKPGALLGEGSLKYNIPAEFDTTLFHKRGALAAAREADDINPQKASSSTQFYIVDGQTFTNAELNRVEQRFNIKIPESHRTFYRTSGGAPFLDMNYTVFGEVLSGMDVVEKIANAPKDENNRPLKDIHMQIHMVK